MSGADQCLCVARCCAASGEGTTITGRSACCRTAWETLPNRIVAGAADDAVAASCAIPGFYRPVEIAGRRYVDGGVASTSNLDVLAGLGLDLVICLNPTSSLHAPQPRTLGERAAAVLREGSGRRLGSEAKRVRASGTEVVLIQPAVQDLDAMGGNLMSAKRRHQVIEVAAQTVASHLREPGIRARLSELPSGESVLVRRPPGPLAQPPDFGRLARRRWVAAAKAS
ncbi:MAG: patatin-like phospholipase family protein [Solirubrobacteraceae bacterium]